VWLADRLPSRKSCRATKPGGGRLSSMAEQYAGVGLRLTHREGLELRCHRVAVLWLRGPETRRTDVAAADLERSDSTTPVDHVPRTLCDWSGNVERVLAVAGDATGCPTARFVVYARVDKS